MIETLLGGLLGGAFRLAPEVLKWFDRQGERGHELAMQDKALEFEKLRGAQRMSEIGAAADGAWNTGAIETLRDAVRTQGEKTGVAWADALSSTVRPVCADMPRPRRSEPHGSCWPRSGRRLGPTQRRTGCPCATNRRATESSSRSRGDSSSGQSGTSCKATRRAWKAFRPSTLHSRSA